MAKKLEPMVRLTPKLVRQVDAHAKYLHKTTGMSVSRTSAARALLTEALEKRRGRV
jgi:hypothetical protein